MAKITTENIETLPAGIIIYKFPASDGKSESDLTNCDFYYISKIIGRKFREDNEFKLCTVVTPVKIGNIQLTSKQTTKTYKELTNGKWYTYQLQLTGH
jgi:uncharacterized protein YdaL